MNKLITIPFHNQTIVAIEHNGKPYIAMRPIVENLGLDWASQYVKLTERFSKGVVMITTPSAGGSQEMLCLPLTKLAAFLYSINASKVNPKLRDIIIAYQEECDEVLFNHFISRYQADEYEHNALLECIFARRPQWRKTVDYTKQGLTTGQIAKLQNKCKSSVRSMKARIRAAGIDLNPQPLCE